MVYWYNSTSYYDDLMWAAAWLYKATGDPGYMSDAYTFFYGHQDSAEGIYDKEYLVSTLSQYVEWTCRRLKCRLPKNLTQLTDDLIYEYEA